MKERYELIRGGRLQRGKNMIRKLEEIIVKVVKGAKFPQAVHVNSVNAAERSSKIKTEKIALHLEFWSSSATLLSATK